MGVFLNLNGVYCMKNYRDSRGQLRKFGCRLVEISPETMSLIVPVQGRVGEEVETDLEEFGALVGKISKKVREGFVVDIAATDEERRALTKKIVWQQEFRARKVEDKRKYPRIVPKKPISILILLDGTWHNSLVIDVSAAGVAVSSEIMPDIGTPLAVGRVVGKVARHLPAGFAVEFAEIHDLASIERAINYVPRQLLNR